MSGEFFMLPSLGTVAGGGRRETERDRRRPLHELCLHSAQYLETTPRVGKRGACPEDEHGQAIDARTLRSSGRTGRTGDNVRQRARRVTEELRPAGEEDVPPTRASVPTCHVERERDVRGDRSGSHVAGWGPRTPSLPSAIATTLFRGVRRHLDGGVPRRVHDRDDAGILVFLHADRHGSKHTTAWGICVFLFLGIALPVYLIHVRRARRVTGGSSQGKRTPCVESILMRTAEDSLSSWRRRRSGHGGHVGRSVCRAAPSRRRSRASPARPPSAAGSPRSRARGRARARSATPSSGTAATRAARAATRCTARPRPRTRSSTRDVAKTIGLTVWASDAGGTASRVREPRRPDRPADAAARRDLPAARRRRSPCRASRCRRRPASGARRRRRSPTSGCAATATGASAAGSRTPAAARTRSAPPTSGTRSSRSCRRRSARRRRARTAPRPPSRTAATVRRADARRRADRDRDGGAGPAADRLARHVVGARRRHLRLPVVPLRRDRRGAAARSAARRGQTYTLVSRDVGKTLGLALRATDSSGHRDRVRGPRRPDRPDAVGADRDRAADDRRRPAPRPEPRRLAGQLVAGADVVSRTRGSAATRTAASASRSRARPPRSTS